MGEHRWGGGGRGRAVLLATLLGVVSLVACGDSDLEVVSGPGGGEPPPAQAGEDASALSAEPAPTGTPDTLPPSTSSSTSSSSTSTTQPDATTSTTSPDPGEGAPAPVTCPADPATRGAALQADLAAAECSVGFVNQKRAENGRGPLTTDPELQAAAQEWVRQMATDQNMRHDPDRADKMPARYSSWGENVAYGHSQASIDQAWWDSEGHRANILGRQYDSVGIAFVRDGDGTFWAVQIFGGT